MVVLVLSACPVGLRGQLTRWLLEISAGVFVGRVSTRVRDLLWQRAVEMVGQGRAIMVYSAANEQRLEFRVHGHHWEPVDFDGISLMMRPNEGGDVESRTMPQTGWSSASSANTSTAGSLWRDESECENDHSCWLHPEPRGRSSPRLRDQAG
ncbi:type I-E CRISPR-associated endoribonuclease Cas2e [Saxibacter everestensis]|uniref:Type I-E CRISPR-associated endoribonuclease Cas2e n=1 Tax=Saxibacter everestensis TaxID=2909229 RepID=A0ABY8QVG7_9MICO|nr:type I-E CRISPR-associated endoribonuclease Cas2e [Brevibacteriaceae bacterium ZFBP1038]